VSKVSGFTDPLAHPCGRPTQYSIESSGDDMIGGFNAFLDEQIKQPGTATLTLVQFDSHDSYEIIYDFKLH
jgi:hypothetical protein